MLVVLVIVIILKLVKVFFFNLFRKLFIFGMFLLVFVILVNWFVLLVGKFV